MANKISFIKLYGAFIVHLHVYYLDSYVDGLAYETFSKTMEKAVKK